MFNWKDIWVLYRRELRCALRERSIIVNSIILQIVLYPALLWLVYSGISFVQGQTEDYTSRVMLRALPTEHRVFRQDLEKTGSVALEDIGDPEAALRDGSLDLLIDFLPVPGGLPGNFEARLTYDDSKDRSRMALDRVSEYLRRYRDGFLEQEGLKLGLTLRLLQPVWVASKNVATSRKMGQFLLGRMLPIFLIIMLNIGCMYPAIDSTAGEREKSTWETTLTYATSRPNIVAAKYLYVSTMAAFAGILNLAAMLLTVRSVLAPLLADRADEFSFRIEASSVPLILLMDVLLALFVAAGMMILASFARNFKEGQSLISPFYLAIFLPLLFLQMPGLQLTPVLALVPVVNVALVFRDAVSGIYNWPLIGVTLAVEIVSIVVFLRLATLILGHEDYVMGSYSGNFGRFIKERLLRKGSYSRRGGKG